MSGQTLPVRKMLSSFVGKLSILLRGQKRIFRTKMISQHQHVNIENSGIKNEERLVKIFQLDGTND